MDRALSTYLLVNHRLTTVWLDRIWDAGIPLVELFCARQHFDYRDRAQIAEMGHWFRDSELKLHSLHAPLYSDDVWGRTGPDSVINITEPVKIKRLHMVDEIKRALDVAEYVPFKYMIQHIGSTGEEFDEHKIDAAFSALEELSIFARQRGVEMLLENTPNALSSAERLLLFFETTHMDLNVCLDTGHANMKEGVETAIRLLKPRIRSTHLHDNNGVDDAHLFPLAEPPEGAKPGNIDWAKTMRGLKSINSGCPLLMELRELPAVANPLAAVRESFEKLEEIATKDES